MSSRLFFVIQLLAIIVAAGMVSGQDIPLAGSIAGGVAKSTGAEVVRRFNLDASRMDLKDVTDPLFSGFLTRYQVEEARATLSIVKANEQSLRQLILLEIQQAYLNLREAEERIATAELTVRQAAENLEIANGRYDAGVGNPVEVTDALTAYSNAKTAYNGALYDYNVAQANLEKAMGGRQ